MSEHPIIFHRQNCAKETFYLFRPHCLVSSNINKKNQHPNLAFLFCERTRIVVEAIIY